jgi:hypothetical protein
MMNSHKSFENTILPWLLQQMEDCTAIKSVLSINLYGSANYDPTMKLRSPNDLTLRDYDTWIIFKKDSGDLMRRFASHVFGVDFSKVSTNADFVLYDQQVFTIHSERFLLSLKMVMEETYSMGQALTMQPITVPWYRPRKREREPIVPLCSRDFTWFHFDMGQRFDQSSDLWILNLPLLPLDLNNHFTLGTFVECSLSSRQFYGEPALEKALQARLLSKVINAVFGEVSLSGKNKSLNMLVRMMTLHSKASPAYRDELRNHLQSLLRLS